MPSRSRKQDTAFGFGVSFPDSSEAERRRIRYDKKRGAFNFDKSERASTAFKRIF